MLFNLFKKKKSPQTPPHESLYRIDLRYPFSGGDFVGNVDDNYVKLFFPNFFATSPTSKFNRSLYVAKLPNKSVVKLLAKSDGWNIKFLVESMDGFQTIIEDDGVSKIEDNDPYWKKDPEKNLSKITKEDIQSITQSLVDENMTYTLNMGVKSIKIDINLPTKSINKVVGDEVTKLSTMWKEIDTLSKRIVNICGCQSYITCHDAYVSIIIEDIT